MRITNQIYFNGNRIKLQSFIGNVMFHKVLNNVLISGRVSMWIEAKFGITNTIFLLNKNPIGI